MIRRLIAAAIAVIALAMGSWIASHYPFARPWVLLAFVAWTVVAFRFPSAWLLVLPATLPVLGFASWTGWLLVEELDLVLLAVLTAGYARIAIVGGDSTHSSSVYAKNFWSSLVVAMLAIWTVFEIYRGFMSAPSTSSRDPFIFGLQDYDGALNSLRIGKSFLWAALLVPLLHGAFERGAGVLRPLAAGLAVGAAAAGLTVMWERAAFTGVLDFSDDYRATGLFWEMHVGGAALDGFVALTLPFALRLAFSKGSTLQRVAGVFVSMLAGYACLATFSRGLYAGVAISIALLTLIVSFRRERTEGTSTAVIFKGVFFALAAAATYLAFRHGGYRSTAAVLGVWCIALLVETAAFQLAASRYVVAMSLGLAIGISAASLAPQLNKGPYVIFAVAWTACAATALAASRRPHLSGVAVGGFSALFPLAAGVALHWGGRQAFDDSVVILVAGLLFVAAARLARIETVRGGFGERFTVMLCLGAVSAIIVVFTAGAYMSNRFGTSQEDLAGRIDHWRAGLSLIRSTTEWAIGKGFGRFPQEYYFGVPDNAFPGRHRFASEADGNRYVTLTGPNHVLGFGELYRFAQRVRPGRAAPFVIALDVRSGVEAGLHLEICEQHLLYNGNCAFAEVPVHPTHGAWQHVVTKATGAGLGESAWYAPRLAFFSIALSTRLHSVDIDNISVIDTRGRELLANGSFDAGGRSWFFVSDRYHLPWHIKSMYLNVLFEEGWAGVGLFMLALALAFNRLLLSPARTHVLAPYLASALTGFLVVGLFDSLLDVPRVAFLFYLLLVTSLFLPDSNSPRNAKR